MTTDDSRIQPGQAKQAAKTTIVGGQPPGNQRLLAEVPVGLEQLLAMAASSEEFAQVLRTEPARAIEASGLQLTDTERAVLRATPTPMLEKMIQRVQMLLPQPERRIFLERAAAALTLLLGVGALGACKDDGKGARSAGGDAPGGRPGDMPRPMDQMRAPPPDATTGARPAPPTGSRPDRPRPMEPTMGVTRPREPPMIQAGATQQRPISPSAGGRIDRPMVPDKRARPDQAPKSRGISHHRRTPRTGIRPGRRDDDE